MPGSWAPRFFGLTRIEAHFQAFGRRSSFVLWVLFGQDQELGVLEALAQAVADWDSGVFAGLRSENSFLESVYVLGCGGRPSASFNLVGIHQGGIVAAAVAEMIPSSVAPLVRGLDPRGFPVNRVYPPGLVRGYELPFFRDDDAMVVPEIAALAIEQAYRDLRDALLAVPHVPHFTLANVVAPSLAKRHGSVGGVPTFTSVVDYHCDRHYMGSQVRRGPGRQAGTVN